LSAAQLVAAGRPALPASRIRAERRVREV